MPGPVAQAADFFRKTLVAHGSIDNKKANPDSETDKYQSLGRPSGQLDRSLIDTL
jgi:hypothetical protein